MKYNTLLLIFILLITSAALGFADNLLRVQSEKEAFKVKLVWGSIERPWSLAFLPDNNGILVTERTGNLLLIRDGRSDIVAGIPKVAVVGQGALLDVVLSPSFTSDSLVYLSYTEENNGEYGTAVARGRLVSENSDTARLMDTVMLREWPEIPVQGIYGFMNTVPKVVMK